MKRQKGLFIALEGIEGSGKTTHCKQLCRFLRKSGYRVLKTREPGGTPLGLAIRRILLSEKSRMSAEAETLLYLTSRAELVRQVLKPKLSEGYVVVSDRWMDATFAYQGYGLKVERRWIQEVARKAVGALKPDLTLLLDLPVAVGLARARRRGKLDRIEKRSIAFHRRVRRGYLALARQNPKTRLIRVRSLEETQAAIRKEVLGVL